MALALVLGACGSDSVPDSAAPEAPVTDALAAALVSSRDTLPPAPGSASTVTVVLVHPDGADAPGLDAAAGALAQRPDLDVVVVAPETGADLDAARVTMSGFPVVTTAGSPADAVTSALTATAADLVVVGVTVGHGIGAIDPAADAALAAGVPALTVGVESAGGLDYAAATMQLLEVLDLELDELLGAPAVHRLAVPTCARGTLRGRVVTVAAPTPAPRVRSDCASREPAGAREDEALARGWVTLSRVR